MAQNAGTPASISGTGSDLETFNYLRKDFAVLPDPPGIPFYEQGIQIIDPTFKSIPQEAIIQCTTNTTFNPLPYQRWIGTSTQQKHYPQFLSVNEIFLQQ